MRRKAALGFLMAGVLASCGAGIQARKGDADMEALKAQVLAKDPAAALRARQLGRPAAAVLVPLASHEDAGVRRVALNCLRDVGGAEAVKVFLQALADDDPQVAGSAAKGFDRHFDAGHAPALLQAYDKAPEPQARQEIALFLGRSKNVDPKELRKRLAAEKEGEAVEGLVAALARLGEKEAQEEFVRKLHASKERSRLHWIEHARYVHAPWLLKPLAPLLDDKEVLVRHGQDLKPDRQIALRTCDLVVNLVASISGRKFSFKVEESSQYADAEIDEVRKFLKTM